MKDHMSLDDLMETMRSDSARPLNPLFEQEAPPKKPEEEEKKKPDDKPEEAPEDKPEGVPEEKPNDNPEDKPEEAPEEEPKEPEKKPDDKPEKPEEPAAEREGDDNVVAALNSQQNHELGNWYKYYKAAAWFDDEGYPGMAKWAMKQAKDELKHAEMIFHYLLDRNQPLVLADIKAEQASWSTPLDVFKFAHQTEMDTTDRLERIHQLADDQHDRQTMAFLKELLDEQVEEEAVTLLMVQRAERVGDDGAGWNQLDYMIGDEMEDAGGRLRESVLGESINITVNNNFSKVNIGRAIFWFSYKTCIAFDTPSSGLVCSENNWSTTTGKHLNLVQPEKKNRIPYKEFEQQLEKVISGANLRESASGAAGGS